MKYFPANSLRTFNATWYRAQNSKYLHQSQQCMMWCGIIKNRFLTSHKCALFKFLGLWCTSILFGYYWELPINLKIWNSHGKEKLRHIALCYCTSACSIIISNTIKNNGKLKFTLLSLGVNAVYSHFILSETARIILLFNWLNAPCITIIGY
jgi:predicted acyltransferase